MSSKSKNVFLAPCDPENFDRTVRSAVDLSEVPDCPSALDGVDEARFWGARVGSQNRTYFEKMESGDLVLFYQGGNYVGSGWIGATFEDDERWASSTFWRGVSSQLIYTVEEFRSVSVQKAAVNRIFDYADGYSPRGLTRVADERVSSRPESIKLAVERYDRKNG